MYSRPGYRLSITAYRSPLTVYRLLSLGVELVLDAEPLNAIAQRAESDAQQPCCGRTVVVGLFERFQYGFFFYPLAVFGQRRGCPQSHEILPGDGLGVPMGTELQFFDADLVSRR